ncbi:MAG: DsrE family protein [Desulfobaccales bacterium]
MHRRGTTLGALVLLAAAVLLLLGQSGPSAPGPQSPKMAPASDSLVVVWTSGDPAVAREMVFGYLKNSKLKNYWGRVRLVIWGPSTKLLATDQAMQTGLAQLKAAGVELMACQACADRYGVTEKLRTLGVEVIYMGKPLTEMLKSGWTCLTF